MSLAVVYRFVTANALSSFGRSVYALSGNRKLIDFSVCFTQTPTRGEPAEIPAEGTLNDVVYSCWQICWNFYG